MGGQYVRAIFDTGSFELLLFSKNCKSWSCAKTDSFYDEKASTTFQNLKWTRMHSFGSGDCMSVLSKDLLTVGPMTANQSFWNVVDANMPIIQDGSFDGILGLAQPNGPIDEVKRYLKEDAQQMAQCENTTEGCPEWLLNQTRDDKKFKKLVKQHPPVLKEVGITKFSVCFQKEPLAPGYFTWNDLDAHSAPKGVFETLKVSGNYMWGLPLEQVKLGNFMKNGKSKKISIGCGKNAPCTGILDTGTSLVAAPSAVLSKISQKLEKVDSSCDRLDEMPDLVFKYGGKKIVMPPSTYIGKVIGQVPARLRKFFPHVKTNDDDKTETPQKAQCTLLMMSMDMTGTDGKPMWIIGMPFFPGVLHHVRHG
jgi:hypothetical protein